MSHCWRRSEFPCAYEVCICSINSFRCLVIGLEAPYAFCCLNFCLTWLSWRCLAAIFQVCLVCWKKGLHFLWKLFTRSSADKLVSCLMSHCWRWGEFPCAYEVCVCSINSFRGLVIGLEAPCAFRCLNLCLTWLSRSRLTTVFQVCLVCWKQGFHFLWKVFAWSSADKFMCCLVSWCWGKFPSTDEVGIRSIDGF